MTLGGYEKNGGKRSGGISSILLAAAKDVTGVECNVIPEVCTAISLNQGVQFAKYEFKEGEAFYAEEMSIEGRVTRVRHEITFTIERPDSGSAQAVARLAKTSAEGMVAIITTNSNVCYLVGCSEKFGMEQPLRLSKASLTTGMTPSDDTKEVISLVSEDDSKAMVYTGNVGI